MKILKNLFVVMLGLLLLANIGFSALWIANETGHDCSGDYPSFDGFNDSSLGGGPIQNAIYYAWLSGGPGSTVIVCSNGTAGASWSVATLQLNTSINLVGNDSNVVLSAANAALPILVVNSNYTNVTNFTFIGATTSIGLSINSTGSNIYRNQFNATNLYGISMFNATLSPKIYRNVFYGANNFAARSITISSLAVSGGATSLPSSKLSGANISQNSFVGTAFTGTAIDGNYFYDPILLSNNFTQYDTGLFLNNTALGGTLSLDIFYNNTLGLYLDYANSTTVQSCTFYNNTNYTVSAGSILLNHANWSTFTSVSVEGNASGSTTEYGINLLNAAHNAFSSMTIFNFKNNNFLSTSVLSAYTSITGSTIRDGYTGISLSNSGTYTNITNNTMYNLRTGISASTANYMVIADNYLYNCSNSSGACIYLDYGPAESSTVVYNNNITNSSGMGVILDIQMFSATSGTFYNNRITNATTGINVSQHMVNFSGNNYVYNTPVTGVDLLLSPDGANFSTGKYNLTTTFASFMLANATNISVKAVNVTAQSIPVHFTALGNLVGSGTFSSAKIIRLDSAAEYAALNITNVSTTNAPTFSLTMFYNSVDKGTTFSYTGLSLSSTGGSSWGYYIPTAVLAPNAYYYGNTQLTGLFSIVGYNLAQSSSGSSVASTNKYAPDLAKSFDCAKGTLEASVVYSGSGVSGLEVRLYDANDFSYVSKTTDSDGKVVFTIAEDGTYQLETVSGSGYSSAAISNFELKLCPATPAVEETVETPEEVITETPSEEQPPVVTVSAVTKDDVLVAISSADSVIVLAIKENKDVSSAKAKLSEASVLLATGDFEGAKKLAEEALTLAQTAKVKPAATTPTTPTKPATTTTPTQKGGFDLGSILLIVVVVAVVIGGIFYFTKMRGKGAKGHRRF